jgi:transposase
MKRDGRSLDHQTLEVIRTMAVERVREGESPSAVVAAYGFCRTMMEDHGKWLKAASPSGPGLQAKPLDGRPRKLTARQEKLVFRWVNGRDPRQYGMDFGLWTRSVVASLIEEKFKVQLGLTAVGELLARLGLTPQKPLQRAYQRDPEAIEKWQRETFPAIAKLAKKQAGEVYFGMSPAFGLIPCMAKPGP